jgi:hypothetical protein
MTMSVSFNMTERTLQHDYERTLQLDYERTLQHD